MHHALGSAGAVALDVELEIVGIPGHHHLDLVLAQECLQGREVVVTGRQILAARVERMAEDGHLELAARLLERRTEPRELVGIDAPEHARVDGEQGEALGLDLEVGRALQSSRDAVLALQARGLSDQPGDATSVVLVSRLSASIRARMAAAAASGAKNVAAKPSRASYQSWLPGIA